MNSKSFGLFAFGVLAFVFLMSAVSAATITSWNFDSSTLTPSAGAGTLTTNTGATVAYVAGNPAAGKSLSLDNWDASEFVLINLSTTGYDDIILSFDQEASATGPTSFKIQYSSDGVTFTDLAASTTATNVAPLVFTANPMHTFSFASITALDNIANARLRIVPSGATNAAGVLHLDNILVSGTALPAIPSEITACTAVGNPGSLDVRKIDFTNNGLSFDGKTFGKDDEWFSLENIEVQIEIKNNGNDNVDDVEVSWGLYDTRTNKWVIDYDNEDEFNLKDGDKELVTVSFKLDDDLDVDLEDLSDGNNYKFYVTASGTVDNATALSTCVSDFEQASVVIESDFVILDSFQLPETAQCGATVEVSADAWNIGDRDQDAVSVQATNSELKLSEEILVGDMNAFDNQKVSLTFKVPNDAAEKTYPIKFEVLDEDGGVYQNNYDDDYAEFTVPLTVKGSCAGTAAPVTVTANLVSGGQAGQDMVIKSTVTNTGAASATYTLSSAGHGSWASAYTVNPTSLALAAGQSADATFTFKLNQDAAGEQTFYIELVSGTQVTRQPVSVVIKEASFFSSITGGAISGSSGLLWGLGILNVVLIIVIILVAMRVMRK
jgi:hypothetical protein